jgi:hypothetical protein
LKWGRRDISDFAGGHFDALREGAEMITAVTAAVDSDQPAGDPGEPPNHRRRDRLRRDK